MAGGLNSAVVYVSKCVQYVQTFVCACVCVGPISKTPLGP